MSARAAHLRAARRAREESSGLRVVRRRSRSLIQREAARRATPLVIVALILVLALVFTVLLEQVLMAQSAFKLGKIRSRMSAEEARHEDLVWQATRLESPKRIEMYARETLGMVEADPLRTDYIVADINKGSGGSRLASAPEVVTRRTAREAAASATTGGP